jgi:hypothetical protein
MKNWSKFTVTAIAVVIVGTSLMAFHFIDNTHKAHGAADHTIAITNA